jgi:proteasome accessory factor C
MVPYVAASPDGVRVTELCERFGVAERQLLADLTTLSFVGVPPFTPDALVEVMVEDGLVWIRPQFFDRPLRLTPEQALALVVAGEALRAGPGEHDPALTSALAKLRSALDVDADAVEVDLGAGDPQLLSRLTEAIEQHRATELDYYSMGRDRRSRRVVEPWRLFSDQGHWYLSARCRTAEGTRVFRIDRIAAATVLDDRFEAPRHAAGPSPFTASDDDPRIELEVTPAGRWVAEEQAVEEATELPGGRVAVRLAVSGTSWLERLLLRLGPEARVTRTDADLEGIGRRAATRILARYDDRNDEAAE